MKNKYTKKQILESINYWKKQLKIGNYKKIDESYSFDYNDEIRASLDQYSDYYDALSACNYLTDDELQVLDYAMLGGLSDDYLYDDPMEFSVEVGSLEDYAKTKADYIYVEEDRDLIDDPFDKKTFIKILLSTLRKMQQHGHIKFDPRTRRLDLFTNLIN